MVDRSYRSTLAGLLVAASLALAGAAAGADSTVPEKLPDAAAGLEQVAADQVVALLGLGVRAQGGDVLGRIVDVLVNAAGEPRAAIVDVGGFLGVGNRKVAVDWRALRFAVGATPFATLPVPAERIKSAPAYDPAKPVEMVEAPLRPAPPPALPSKSPQATTSTKP